MTQIQIELTSEENEILGLVKVMQKLKSKEEAVKYIINIYGNQNGK